AALPDALRAKYQSLIDSLVPKNIVPGWSHHGGGGQGKMELDTDDDGQEIPGDFALGLVGPYSDPLAGFVNLLVDVGTLGVSASFAANTPEAGRVHNLLYVPPAAGSLESQREPFFGTSADKFVVRLGGRILGEPIDLSVIGALRDTPRLPIPKEMRGGTY